jgi:hypothetical protein
MFNLHRLFFIFIFFLHKTQNYKLEMHRMSGRISKHLFLTPVSNLLPFWELSDTGSVPVPVVFISLPIKGPVIFFYLCYESQIKNKKY